MDTHIALRSIRFFFCRENPVQRNVHFLRFHIVWVHISRHKKKKITIQCMKLLCNCKKQKERRSKKRKINNRFLGTKAFSSIYFFLHSLNVDRWYFFMFVQSSVRRKMKTCEKERKKNCTHTQCAVLCIGYPVGQFQHDKSCCVIQVIFVLLLSYRNVWSIFSSDTLLQYIAYLNSTPVRTPTIQLTASNKITKITKNYIHPIECRRRSRILIRLWLHYKWQRFRSCSKWGRKHFCVSKLLFVFWKKGRQRKWCVIVGNACIISCKIKMQTHWHN